MRFHRKEYRAVEAQQYDGSFDLDFLRPDERLTAGEPDGATVLIHRDGIAASDGFTVEIAKGAWAIRLRDGHITTMVHDQFVDEYQPVMDQAAGHTFAMNLRPQQHAVLELMAAVYLCAEAGVSESRTHEAFEDAWTTTTFDRIGAAESLTPGQKQNSPKEGS